MLPSINAIFVTKNASSAFPIAPVSSVCRAITYSMEFVISAVYQLTLLLMQAEDSASQYALLEALATMCPMHAPVSVHLNSMETQQLICAHSALPLVQPAPLASTVKSARSELL